MTEGGTSAARGGVIDRSTSTDPAGTVSGWRILVNRAHVRAQVVWLSLRYRLVLRTISLGTLLTLVGLAPVVLDVLDSNGVVSSRDLVLILVTAAVALTVAWILSAAMLYRSGMRRFRSVRLPPWERDEMLAAVEPPRGSDADLRIDVFPHPGGAEWYALSPAVNAFLEASAADRPLRLMSETYELPDVVRPFVPGLLAGLLRKRSVVHDGRHVGLRTDLTTLTTSVALQRTRYLETQSADEIFDRRLWDVRDVEPRFEGRRLVLDDDGRLKPLELTAATNQIGASTLVITADGYVYFQRQGAASNVNSGRWAPSGSGSVDYRDFTVVRRRAREAQRAPALADLLTEAVEREFAEEFGIPRHLVGRTATRVVGYARLLNRGGKPDFFLVTRLSLTRDEIDALVARRRDVAFRERGLSTMEKVSIPIGADFGAAIRGFLEREPNQSIQNHLFGVILRDAAQPPL